MEGEQPLDFRSDRLRTGVAQYISEILRKHQENVSHVATHWTCPALHLRRWDMPSANSYLHLVGEVLTARGIAEEKPSENIMVAAASSLLWGFSDRFQAGAAKHDYAVLTHLSNRDRGVGCLFGYASVRGKRGSRTGSVAGCASIATEPKSASMSRKAT
jgi:hypothetical protein